MWSKLLTASFFFLGSSLFILSAQDFESTDRWIACKNMTKIGTFEQCQELRVMKRVGQQIRAFGLHDKKLHSFEESRVLAPHYGNSSRDFQAGDKLLVPGKLLWPATSDKTLSLCQVVSIPSPTQVQIDCGKGHDQLAEASKLVKIGKSFKELYPAPEPKRTIQTAEALKADR